MSHGTAGRRMIVITERTHTAPKLTSEPQNARVIGAPVLRQLAAGVAATAFGASNAKATLPLFVLQPDKQLRSCVRVQSCDYRSAISCKITTCTGIGCASSTFSPALLVNTIHATRGRRSVQQGHGQGGSATADLRRYPSRAHVNVLIPHSFV
jgi:hypothetical protein